MPPVAAPVSVTLLPNVMLVAEILELLTSVTGTSSPSAIKVFDTVAEAPLASVITHLIVCCFAVAGVHE